MEEEYNNRSRKVGFLSANKMPLRQHEMVYVFKEKGGTYNPQKTEGKPHTHGGRNSAGLYSENVEKYKQSTKAITRTQPQS